MQKSIPGLSCDTHFCGEIMRQDPLFTNGIIDSHPCSSATFQPTSLLQGIQTKQTYLNPDHQVGRQIQRVSSTSKLPEELGNSTNPTSSYISNSAGSLVRSTVAYKKLKKSTTATHSCTEIIVDRDKKGRSTDIRVGVEIKVVSEKKV
ncbi:hypothetical protein AGMMS49921_01570 [Endomicrobiia bacterium]|nr:hypothetical protein AGMMS49921_01570 [Endomicrobiia bacterium]